MVHRRPNRLLAATSSRTASGPAFVGPFFAPGIPQWTKCPTARRAPEKQPHSRPQPQTITAQAPPAARQPKKHPFIGRFLLGPFFQRTRKPAMMRTRTTPKVFWPVFSASPKTRHDARTSYPQKFFQPPEKPVMMRTRAPQRVFPADARIRHDAGACTQSCRFSGDLRNPL